MKMAVIAAFVAGILVTQFKREVFRFCYTWFYMMPIVTYSRIRYRKEIADQKAKLAEELRRYSTTPR